MHLQQPFFKIARRFDVLRLRKEVDGMSPEAWVPDADGLGGNSSIRLISADGGENDLVEGRMRETTHLIQAPYLRQVLASFNVAWSRTRLLRLAPGATVPVHADINYHEFYRVRLHIPIVTRPEVHFHCDTTTVHMAAGEAWAVDNWRLHRVVNPTDAERIHLVADTAGNATFWRLVGAVDEADEAGILPFRPGRGATLFTERGALRPVMNPAELELLVAHLLRELSGAHDPLRLARYCALLEAFVRDWRERYLLHGEDPSGWKYFRELRDALCAASRPLADGLVMRTNGVGAHRVLEDRVLCVCVRSIASWLGGNAQVKATSAAIVASSGKHSRLTRPLLIMAAPRSGSSLLFETLASSTQLATLGGEAHWLVESIPELRPGAPGIDSNRLLAQQATPAIIGRIRKRILASLMDRHGHAVRNNRLLRFLEKTPQNALRIPFFNRVFPDALHVYLWREPRGSISSIIEAWRSGKWRTYPRLEGLTLPWSMSLPPGWQTMFGCPLEEVAAFQWQVTNEIILNDLVELPASRWMIIAYDDFVATPLETIRRICRFAGLEFDNSLFERASKPLPPAKHTLTPVDPHKWQRNAAAVERVLTQIEPTWSRLQQTTRACTCAQSAD